MNVLVVIYDEYSEVSEDGVNKVPDMDKFTCPKCEESPPDILNFEEEKWFLGDIWDVKKTTLYRVVHCLNCGTIYGCHLT